jgi:hypothetical protein
MAADTRCRFELDVIATSSGSKARSGRHQQNGRVTVVLGVNFQQPIVL